MCFAVVGAKRLLRWVTTCIPDNIIILIIGRGFALCSQMIQVINNYGSFSASHRSRTQHRTGTLRVSSQSGAIIGDCRHGKLCGLMMPSLPESEPLRVVGLQANGIKSSGLQFLGRAHGSWSCRRRQFPLEPLLKLQLRSGLQECSAGARSRVPRAAE